MRVKETVEASAPTRIDLAGGTLDIWPLYLFHPGSMTLNAAIDIRARVRVQGLDHPGVRFQDRTENRTCTFHSLESASADPSYTLFLEALHQFSFTGGVSVQFCSEAPKGAGLAGSSSLLTAFCGALMKGSNQVISRETFIALIRDIEARLIRVPTGMQDYYPAVWGGIQALHWQAGGVKREPLAVCPAELEKRLLLVYTGISRHSGTNNWEVFKRHLDGDRKIHLHFARIVEATQKMYNALKVSDFSLVGKAMAEEYEARKGLFPGISTKEIDSLERFVKRSGARALKVCGAGGGGCVVVYTEPDRKSFLERKIQDRGFIVLPFTITGKGLKFRKGGVVRPLPCRDLVAGPSKPV